jgi:hypothetical protein
MGITNEIEKLWLELKGDAIAVAGAVTKEEAKVLSDIETKIKAIKARGGMIEKEAALALIKDLVDLQAILGKAIAYLESEFSTSPAPAPAPAEVKK